MLHKSVNTDLSYSVEGRAQVFRRHWVTVEGYGTWWWTTIFDSHTDFRVNWRINHSAEVKLMMQNSEHCWRVRSFWKAPERLEQVSDEPQAHWRSQSKVWTHTWDFNGFSFIFMTVDIRRSSLMASKLWMNTCGIWMKQEKCEITPTGFVCQMIHNSHPSYKMYVT